MRDDEQSGEPRAPPARVDLLSSFRDAGLDRTRIALWMVAGAIALGLWYFAWRFVGTLILGLFVYYVTRPLFDRIHRRIRNRTLAVVTSLVSVALPVLVLVGWTLAIALQALADFLGPEMRSQLEELAGPYLDVSAFAGNGDVVLQTLVTDPVRFFSTDLGTFVAGTLQGLLASLGTLATAALHAFIVLVLTFYLLRDDHRIAAWSRRTFAGEGGVVEAYLVQVDRELKAVFFGNILNALVTGLLAVVTFHVLNTFAPAVVSIPQPALVGLLVGAASLVPAIGIKLVTLPVGFYLVARSVFLDPSTLWFPLVFLVVSFVVVDYIPDQLLRPYVSGRTLHVGAVMLAYLFGPILFGWYGIFLGPFLLVVVFEFGRVVLPWLVSREEVSPPSVERTGAPHGTAADESPPDGDVPSRNTTESTTDDPVDASEPVAGSGGARDTSGGSTDAGESVGE